MSTLSGATQKGEKGKSKFQSLDINKLYHQTNKGESSEPHLAKSSAPRRHGMLPLGKVPNTRRAPANLPSLKSEHSGNDPSVSLVPSGGTGWGNKPGETGPSPASQPAAPQTSTPTPVTPVPQTHGSSAPVVAGTGMPATTTNIVPQTPVVQQPPPLMKPIIGSTTSSGDKTWSSITCGDSGPSFLAHQSPQFQQEFPSLSGEGAGQALLPGVNGGSGRGPGSGGSLEVQYGPGPSLRPQTEGSWISGGVAPSAGNRMKGSVLSSPQHPYASPDIVGGSQSSAGVSKGNLGQYGVGGVPGGLTSSVGPSLTSTSAPSPPIPQQFRNVMPNFLQKTTGFAISTSTATTTSFQNNIRPLRFNSMDSNRFNSSSRHADPEDIMPRVIKEEDLSRMDEISRDVSWAAQNDIDYNQKIAFSDDEGGTGLDEEKEVNKETDKWEEKKENDAQFESKESSVGINSTNANRSLSHSSPTENKQQIWTGNHGPGVQPLLTSAEFRQYARPQNAICSETMEDHHWSALRKQNKEKMLQVAVKAKQRQEEVEKKFEESHSRTIVENDKNKGKIEIKDEGNDTNQVTASPITDWDKEDSTNKGNRGATSHSQQHMTSPKETSMTDSGSNNFRPIPQVVESRNDSGKLKDWNNRSERSERPEYSRGFDPPPRFQKQMHSHGPPVRAPPSNANLGGYDNGGRWSNQNSHFPLKTLSGNNKRNGSGGPSDTSNDLLENDRFTQKDDKKGGGRIHHDDRDRYRSNNRNDGALDSNKKCYYYDGSNVHFNRSHHRDYDHNNRERIKDKDYRQRDELEWEGRRGTNSSTWDCKQYDDKSQGRRDRPKESFHKPQVPPYSDDRDVDRPQRVEMRDRSDQPPRSELRDSRSSRDSRNSRDSTRDDKSITESSEYAWGMIDYEKDSKEDKPRKKEGAKDDKRDMTRREGHVPGPITKEKMHAYEIKQQLCKADKKEIISSTLINSVNSEEETKSKPIHVSPQPPPSVGNDAWPDNQELSGMIANSRGNSPQPVALGTEDNLDKTNPPKDDKLFDKKRDGNLVKDRDGKGSRISGRGPRNSGRQSDRPYNSNSYNRNSNAPYTRRRSQGRKGGAKDKGPMCSDSDGSMDEVSVSTESGKEDKKPERRLASRTSISGERKRDKDERNSRESKKNDHDKGTGSRKHSGGNYDSAARKESGFAPRGEPSRRGRGSFRTGGRGSLGIGGHYGPPGSKSPFPMSNQPLSLDSKNAEDVEKSNDKPLDTDSLSPTEVDKSKHRSQNAGNITGGNRPPKEGRKYDGHSKGRLMNKNKGSSGGEDRDSTSEGGSDSDVKKGPKSFLKTDKNKTNQRAAGEKRGPYNTAHMNGRVNQCEDGRDNGFQEVRGKKIGKESRPLSHGRKDSKGKNGGGSQTTGVNVTVQGKSSSSKSFSKEWGSVASAKPPRLQKLESSRKQPQFPQQQEVSEMNKINQSSYPLFSPTARDVNCSMTPAPPPTRSAWEKPITPSLRAQSPTNPLHLSSSASNPPDKTTMDIPEPVHSGASSQTGSPSAEKAISVKLAREVVDKGMLDGATPPVQTIIFENTNYSQHKTPDLAVKGKYTVKPNQRIEKGKLEEELEGNVHGIASLSFKGVELKPCDNRTTESLQMPLAFKNEDAVDMKLDFQFDSDLSQLTEDKNKLSRAIHLGQSSAELNQKIASVKKVWDTVNSANEHSHHVDESHMVATSSSFTPNFGSGVEAGLDHTSSHQVDDQSFNNADVYSQGMQGTGPSYTSSAATMIKPDTTNPAPGQITSQHQQVAVMSSNIGTHSGQSLPSPPPPFNQAGHFGYQTQYGNISTIPSPPAVLVNTQGAQLPPNSQDYVQQHPYSFSSATIISNQNPRSNYSQQATYPYNMTQNLNQTSYAQPQSTMYIPTQPSANAPPEMYSSVGAAYRMQASYGQSPQLNNNSSAVLITSSNNSMMSATPKNTPPPPPPIGQLSTKPSFQNSQLPMGFMSYEPHSLMASFLATSPLVTQRHGGGNIASQMQASTSYYSGNPAAPTGFSSLLGTNNQSMHSAAFGMPSYSNQSTATPGSAPPSSNVGHPSFTVANLRAAPAYMKANTQGPHQPDASKSPSTNQEVLSNSVFSAAGSGNQIPSPKSRTAGGNSGSGKQVSVSPQQPSPTQGHHKFSYSQQSLVGPQHPQNNQAGPQRGNPQLGGAVRTNNGGMNNSAHMKFPGPIQRPNNTAYQHQHMIHTPYVNPQSRHRIQQQHGAPSRQPQQQHVKNNYSFIQQSNPVKIDSGMESKGEPDKFLDTSAKPPKTETKEETANSNCEQ